MSYVIKLEEVKKKYHKSLNYAVDGINLEISKGEIFGLLGPNGAGKSTTLAMISGLLKPTAGKIHYSIDAKELKNKFGYVPQELALFPRLTARENLLFFGRIYGLKSVYLKKRVDEVLTIVGLLDRADELMTTYSVGMSRRINLAIGLIHEPEILLLDEPTVGIDPQSRNCIYENILKLKKQNITVLYTTHYMEEAELLCNRIAIIDYGKIVAEGNPAELVKNQALTKLIFITEDKFNETFCQAVKQLEASKPDFNENQLILNNSANTTNISLIEKIDAMAKVHKQTLRLLKIEEANLHNLFLDLTGREFRD
jgi:ABC-2 type transport system ATP-binding protein